MTREAAVLVLVVVLVALALLAVWGWRRRMRRDGGLAAPIGEAPADAATLATFPVLYVATTVHDEPLNRLAVARLGFRSKADLTVTDAGVALDLTGQPRLFIPADRIAAADQSTVAIDRVVEKDGLTRIVWRIDGERLVDSYLRPQDASARAVADAIGPLIPTDHAHTPTGTDA